MTDDEIAHVLKFADKLKQRINFTCSPVVIYEIIDDTVKDFVRDGVVDNSSE